MRSTLALRSLLLPSLLFVAAAVAAQAPCRRGLGVADPFLTYSLFNGGAKFGDVDGDGRPDAILVEDSTTDSVLLNRGTVYSLESSFYEPPGESLAAVHDQNGDGKGDFIYTSEAPNSSVKRVVFGTGNGAAGEGVETQLPSFFWDRQLPADFDGDGVIDVLELGRDAVRLLKGSRDGRFAEAGTRPAPRAADLWEPLVADFDGDGVPDVATFSDQFSMSGRIFFISRPFEVTTTGMVFASRLPQKLAAGDVDGDGASEILWFERDQLMIFSNRNRTPKVEGVKVLAGDSGPASSVIGITDFDGDGLRDVIAAGGRSSVFVFRGTGNRTWHTPEVYTMSGGWCPELFDLNGDGRDDVVNTCGGSLAALYGGAQPTAPRVFETAGSPSGVAATDHNRDGIADLVTVASSAARIELQLGAQDGTFATAWSLKINSGEGLRIAALADLDRDGTPDLVVQHGPQFKVLWGTATGFTTQLFPLPEGTILGSWRIDGRDVLVVRDGLSLRTLAVSPQREVSASALPPLPEAGTPSLIQADGDPGFEILLSLDEFPGTRILTRGTDGWTAGPGLQLSVRQGVSGDLNGDGRPDLVLWGDSVPSIRLTDGSTYRAGVLRNGPVQRGRPLQVEIVDFDKDGRNDVVVLAEHSFGVLRNLGDGTFEQSVVSSGPMEGGLLLDADRDGWIDVIGLDRPGVTVVRNVCATPRAQVLVTPSVVREGERATVHLQGFPVDFEQPSGFDILHNGVWAHGAASKFAVTSWQTPPLTAGLHTFTIQYWSGYNLMNEIETTIRVVVPGSRRRSARH